MKSYKTRPTAISRVLSVQSMYFQTVLLNSQKILDQIRNVRTNLKNHFYTQDSHKKTEKS